MWVQFLTLASTILSASAADLPSAIKKCRNDNKLNQCIIMNSKEAIRGLLKGYPKLGIPVLDPLMIEKIEQTTSGSRSVSLNLTLTNINAYGIPKAELVKSEFDTAKHIIKFSSKIPQLKLVGNYQLNGKFLIVPVIGNGKMTITIDNLLFTFSVNYNLVNKKGIEYLSPILPPKITYTTTKVSLAFENLFKDDKNLGDNFNKLVNENWKEWDAQVGTGIAEALAHVIGSILKKVTDSVPYNQLFI